MSGLFFYFRGLPIRSFTIFCLAICSTNVVGSNLDSTPLKAASDSKETPVTGDQNKIAAAQKFYTKEYFPEQSTRDGYTGVSNTIHTVEKTGSDEVFVGQRFIQVHIKGDGSCCFYAVGRSRTEVIAAISNFIDQKHTVYTKFKTDRKNLLETLKNLKNAENLKALKISLKQFLDNFDTEFSPASLAVEGIKAPAKRMIAEREMEKTTLLNLDVPQPVEKQATKPTQRQILSNAIEGLDMNYESFLTSLVGEGVSDSWEKATDPKETLKTEVKNLFHQNQKASWMPAGLFAAIADQLNLKVVIWKKSGNGKVSVVQSINAKPTDMGARHVLWTGAHYEILVPLLPD